MLQVKVGVVAVAMPVGAFGTGIRELSGTRLKLLNALGVFQTPPIDARTNHL